MGTREENESLRQLYRSVVADMVESRNEHEKTAPDCGMAPMCVGPRAMVAFARTSSGDSRFPINVIMAAVGEIADLERQVAELADRLEVQRVLTADAVEAWDEGRMEIAKLDDQVRDLDMRCAGLQGELDAWDDVADMIGPIVKREDLG